jgi:hypothetical protein
MLHARPANTPSLGNANPSQASIKKIQANLTQSSKTILFQTSFIQNKA